MARWPAVVDANGDDHTGHLRQVERTLRELSDRVPLTSPSDGSPWVAWPPARNGPCWCGSEHKYKKCYGNPAIV
ncbi:SEC-C metal-binding domain-containing protein [Streptomyces sp. NPDC001617]